MLKHRIDMATVAELCRWNFDADDKDLYVCFGDHEKCEPCERSNVLDHVESLAVIKRLQSELCRLRVMVTNLAEEIE